MRPDLVLDSSSEDGARKYASRKLLNRFTYKKPLDRGLSDVPSEIKSVISQHHFEPPAQRERPRAVSKIRPDDDVDFLQKANCELRTRVRHLEKKLEEHYSTMEKLALAKEQKRAFEQRLLEVQLENDVLRRALDAKKESDASPTHICPEPVAAQPQPQPQPSAPPHTHETLPERAPGREEEIIKKLDELSAKILEAKLASAPAAAASVPEVQSAPSVPQPPSAPEVPVASEQPRQPENEPAPPAPSTLAIEELSKKIQESINLNGGVRIPSTVQVTLSVDDNVVDLIRSLTAHSPIPALSESSTIDEDETSANHTNLLQTVQDHMDQVKENNPERYNYLAAKLRGQARNMDPEFQEFIKQELRLEEPIFN